MKNIILNIIALLVIVIMATSCLLIIKNKNKQIETLYNNTKAYEQELLAENKKIGGIYLLTIDQLKMSNDSMIIALLEVKEELGIKDKQLRSMSGIKTVLRDTVTEIIFRDSIQKEVCNFNRRYCFNDLTCMTIDLEDGMFTADINIEDSFYLYHIQTKEWKQPKFMKRLITFN